MLIKLEFSDRKTSRLQDTDIEYDELMPIPTIGDHVNFNGQVYRVSNREFVYELDEPDYIKILFRCDEVVSG